MQNSKQFLWFAHDNPKLRHQRRPTFQLNISFLSGLRELLPHHLSSSVCLLVFLWRISGQIEIEFKSWNCKEWNFSSSISSCNLLRQFIISRLKYGYTQVGWLRSRLSHKLKEQPPKWLTRTHAPRSLIRQAGSRAWRKCQLFCEWVGIVCASLCLHLVAN